MTRPASEDLRRRVVQAYLNGEGTYDEIAKRFVVGPASVDRWLHAYRERSSFAPMPHGGGNPSKIDKEGMALLTRLVEERPDVTLAELAAEYLQRRKVKLAASMVCRALQRLGLGRKKRLSMRRSSKPTASSSNDGSFFEPEHSLRPTSSSSLTRAV